MQFKNRLKITTSIIGVFILSACGGSSTGGNTTGPTTNTPAPPASGGINYDTPEFRENSALEHINAQVAYENGYTGEGILVAVIDSGVSNVPELSGQLHSASINITTGQADDASDFSGHGTAMAGIIAAKRDYDTNRDSFNMHGIAFNAEVLNINAADPENCTGFDSCSFYHSDLANAYDYAINQGADIINESLGSDSFPTVNYQQAILRAVQADKLIVVPAGNIDDEDPVGTGATIQGSATIALADWANGQIIVAGSVDGNNIISDFSYRAGEDAMNVFLMAPGGSFTTPDHLTDNDYKYVITSGTSVSTAIISGSAALLMQAFPNLSADEVAEILFTTATDLGEPGVDVIYGNGLVNLEEAFRAQGQLTIAGNGLAAATEIGTSNTLNTQNFIYSGGAFGSDISFASELSSISVTDKYDRSYNIDFRSGIHTQKAAVDLDLFMTGAMTTRRDYLNLSDKTSVKMAWQYDHRFNEIDRQQFSNHLDRADSNIGNLRMALTQSIDDNQSLSFSTGMSINEWLDDFRPDDYITPNRNGFQMLLNAQDTMGLSYRNAGKTSYEFLIFSSEGEIPRELSPRPIRLKNNMALSRLHHNISQNFTATLDMGYLKEEGSVLGAISTGAIEIGRGANTGFVGGKLQYNPSASSQLFAQMSYGITKVNSSKTSIIGQVSSLQSYSYMFGYKKAGLLRDNDQISISFSQPLKLQSGTGIISNATSRNYQDNSYVVAYTPIKLAPSGTERDFEIAYSIAEIMGVSARLNFLYQLNPGHVKSNPDATSILLRLGSRF